MRWKTPTRDRPPESLDEYLARVRADELEIRNRAVTPWRASSEALGVLFAGALVVLVGSYGQNAPAEVGLWLQHGSGTVCVVASLATVSRGVKTGAAMLVPALPFTILSTRHLVAALQKCLTDHRWTAFMTTDVFVPMVIAVKGVLLSMAGLLVAIAVIRGRGIRWKK